MQKQDPTEMKNKRKKALDDTLARRIQQEKNADKRKPLTSDTDPYYTEEDAERLRRQRQALPIVDN